MLIDCDTCQMRDTPVCDDCVVTVIFDEGILDIDAEEQDAIAALADAGLVPKLRLVQRRATG